MDKNFDIQTEEALGLGNIVREGSDKNGRWLILK